MSLLATDAAPLPRPSLLEAATGLRTSRARKSAGPALLLEGVSASTLAAAAAATASAPAAVSSSSSRAERCACDSSAYGCGKGTQ